VRDFFDTNMVVSAFLARGLWADLCRLDINEHTVLNGEGVLTALRDRTTAEGSGHGTAS
jgi:hypothetical protein